MFQVIKTITQHDGSQVEYKLWEGADPAKYTGGLGTWEWEDDIPLFTIKMEKVEEKKLKDLKPGAVLLRALHSHARLKGVDILEMTLSEVVKYFEGVPSHGRYVYFLGPKGKRDLVELLTEAGALKPCPHCGEIGIPKGLKY